MAASLVLALAWTVLTPTFQAPDEQTHFSYTQYLAETLHLPGDETKPVYSTEHAKAAAAVGSDQLAAVLAARPEWSPQAYESWRSTQSKDPRDDGGGPTSASSYPPLAYMWQAAGYRIASSGDFFDRLFAARLFAALWLPVTVLATWLLAGELFGRRRLLQLAAAAVPALLPMVAFITGAVNPDGMLFALWTLALWLGVRWLREAGRLWDGAAFVLVVGLACLTKTTSYALLPAAIVALVIGLHRRRALPGVRRLRGAALVLLPLGLTVGLWVLLTTVSLDRPPAEQLTDAARASPGTDWRELGSYLWQFYLPRLPFMADLHSNLPLYQVWIKQGWGAFGWLEIRFPENVYRALALLTAAIGVAAAARLWRARRGIDWGIAAFLALTVAGLLGGLHWTDFHEPTGFMQGRYAFPLIGLVGCAVAAAVDLLPERRRASGVAVVLGGLFAFHLCSFALVAVRFYA